MHDVLRVFLRYCYRPYARRKNLVLRTRNVLLLDENEGTRYMQREFSKLMEAQS
ncbi:MAG: hypothetical protein IJQ56_02335 [Synergistaceae bacterium]|nr:hypothetical protein [Synergistaceae bacterium]